MDNACIYFPSIYIQGGPKIEKKSIVHNVVNNCKKETLEFVIRRKWLCIDRCIVITKHSCHSDNECSTFPCIKAT